jgi:hypothetical protein
MAIQVSQRRNPERFAYPQVVRTKTGDGKEMLVLSGVVQVDKKGAGQQWGNDRLEIRLDIAPMIPRGKHLVAEQHATFVTLNAVFNQGASNNAGYAVDSSFPLVGPDGLVGAEELIIESDIAVRDVDGWLLRAGYNVTLVGRLIDAPPGEP